MSGDNPRYRRYRGGSSPKSGPGDDPLGELRDLRRSERGQPQTPERPSRGRANEGRREDASPGQGARERAGERPGRQASRRPSLSPRRAFRPSRPLGRRLAKWFFVWAFAWVVLSGLLFLVSAQFNQAGVGSGVLGGGATPPVGKSTILVIGSDTRPKDSQEPGARTTGYGLADSIMLLRVGGGKQTKLSIARDTIVPVEGHGNVKINSAYAYGGPELLVKTVEAYLGVDINHTMQIGFSSFPGLIDAMGGITYKGSCVISKISGGYKNGGVTLRIRTGERVHLNGKQALALARTRHNDCDKSEGDLTRARRQQKVLGSMKRRALSPIGFVRLPLIAWEAPKTLNSDMAGPRLIATMAGMALSSSGKTRVLGTESGFIPDDLKRREVDRFLAG
ncbi:MAG: LCP family protein [Solirubrobacteraceae bacterium]|nr:LCP family protein [Solirubrobacteraceae bacterium]